VSASRASFEASEIPRNKRRRPTLNAFSAIEVLMPYSSIGPGESGTSDLATQHDQLVLKHEDLGILGHSVHPTHLNQFEDARGERVEEGERHGGRASPSA
jgi:hypothetical protein